MEETASGRSLASVVTKVINVLICADSRGAGLQDLITEARLNALGNTSQIKVKVVIEVRGGAKIQELIDLAVARSNAHKCDFCIVIGGICNLTERHREDRKQFLTYTDREKPHAVRAAIDRYINSSNIKIYFASITPASILKHYTHYNRGEKPYQENLVKEQQENLIADCTELNNYIKAKNDEQQLPTLSLAGLTFISKRKRDHRTRKLKTLYRFNDRHLYDGVHLDAELKQLWVTSILKFIDKIIKINNTPGESGEEEHTDSQSDEPGQPGTSHPPLQSTDSSESGGENPNFKRRRVNTN